MEISSCRYLNLGLICRVSSCIYYLVLFLDGEILIFFLLGQSSFTMSRAKEINEKIRTLLYMVTCSKPVQRKWEKCSSFKKLSNTWQNVGYENSNISIRYITASPPFCCKNDEFWEVTQGLDFTWAYTGSISTKYKVKHSESQIYLLELYSFRYLLYIHYSELNVSVVFLLFFFLNILFIFEGVDMLVTSSNRNEEAEVKMDLINPQPWIYKIWSVRHARTHTYNVPERLRLDPAVKISGIKYFFSYQTQYIYLSSFML